MVPRMSEGMRMSRRRVWKRVVPATVSAPMLVIAACSGTPSAGPSPAGSSSPAGPSVAGTPASGPATAAAPASAAGDASGNGCPGEVMYPGGIRIVVGPAGGNVGCKGGGSSDPLCASVESLYASFLAKSNDPATAYAGLDSGVTSLMSGNGATGTLLARDIAKLGQEAHYVEFAATSGDAESIGDYETFAGAAQAVANDCGTTLRVPPAINQPAS